MRFISLLSAIAVNVAVGQQLTGYPKVDEVAPINPAWTAALLAGANIPNIPVRVDRNTGSTYGPIIVRCDRDNDWAITYDDGPGPYTPGVVDFYNRTSHKATFFVVGSRVVEYPPILKRVYQAGHEIGIHTWSHRALTTLTNDQIVAEMVYATRAVFEVIGVVPSIMRPPFGDIDDRVVAVINALGFSIAMWNFDTQDVTNRETALPSLRGVIGQRNGYISLEHDLFDWTAAMIPDAANMIFNGGYDVKTVSECVSGVEAYGNNMLYRLDGTTPSPQPQQPAPTATGATRTMYTPTPTGNPGPTGNIIQDSAGNQASSFLSWVVGGIGAVAGVFAL